MEPRPWLQQDQSGLQALLCRDVCGTLSRSQRASLRTGLRSASGAREANRAICVEITQVGVRKLHERPFPTRCARRVCRSSFPSDGYCELAHLSGSDQTLREITRPADRKATVGGAAEQHLVG